MWMAKGVHILKMECVCFDTVTCVRDFGCAVMVYNKHVSC